METKDLMNASSAWSAIAVYYKYAVYACRRRCVDGRGGNAVRRRA